MFCRSFHTEPFYVDLNDLLREVCHIVPPFSLSHLNRIFRSYIRQKWGNLLTSPLLKKIAWICPSSLLPDVSSFSRLHHLFETDTHTSFDDPQAQHNRHLQDSTLLLLSSHCSHAASLRLPCGEQKRVRSRLLQDCAGYSCPARRVLPDPGRLPRLLRLRDT